MKDEGFLLFVNICNTSVQTALDKQSNRTSYKEPALKSEKICSHINEFEPIKTKQKLE